MTIKAIQTAGRQFIRTNAFVSLAGNGLSAVLGLATLALLARLCNQDELGNWLLFLTVYALTDTLRSGLLLNALIRNLATEQDPLQLRRWAGAAWQLSFGLLGGLSVLLLGGAAVGYWLGYGPDWPLRATWLTVLGLVSLPVNISGWLLQARARFKAMQLVRISVQVLFLGSIGLGYWLHQLDSTYLFTAYTLTHLLVGGVVIVNGWAQLGTVLSGTSVERRVLLGFGRYSMGTLLLSNLLRSSDRLLIGSLIGPEAVVIYTLPQRLIELIEMPIRSIVITDMPLLARQYGQRPLPAWAAYFNQQAGRLWLLVLPLSVGGIVAAGPLVQLLGGGNYADSAAILRCFMVYALFLPLERYSGIGLDIVDKPAQNLLKVGCMLLVNLLGDLLAILLFQSVLGVAVASVATFLAGLLLGFRLLQAHAPVSIKGAVVAGTKQVRDLTKKMQHEWVH
ncbi:lipopolysaccharide biosynthesis protein [Spirosoma rhododendri]|uniref:Lipopolysaccharide biosynthesis protein n=1 Tax=Spirosoma rhododendri TaxID=2728024 RepID=A0A7L5DMN7_9BACT|nr:lipopolysaccharide biosynthesis protein [Spirosoma rhododendri]QJD77020.1 lipopolysaccharide biosynthesis protein [Spirosoma rhododendri]